MARNEDLSRVLAETRQQVCSVVDRGRTAVCCVALQLRNKCSLVVAERVLINQG